jgi:hypothetical protein
LICFLVIYRNMVAEALYAKKELVESRQMEASLAYSSESVNT